MPAHWEANLTEVQQEIAAYSGVRKILLVQSALPGRAGSLLLRYCANSELWRLAAAGLEALLILT